MSSGVILDVCRISLAETGPLISRCQKSDPVLGAILTVPFASRRGSLDELYHSMLWKYGSFTHDTDQQHDGEDDIRR